MTNNNRTSCGHGKVLLVDDEPDITTIMGICLEDNGIKADMFNDPLVALSYFKKDLYDLVILDIKMPKMNGLELYREIRKIDDKVKVCFITAFDLPQEEIKNTFVQSSPQLVPISSNTDSYLNCVIRKPVGIDDFVKRVKQELNKL